MSTETERNRLLGRLPEMAELDSALAHVTATDRILRDARADQAAALRDRDQAVRRAHKLGASYRQIAGLLGVHHNHVYEICNPEKRT
jgi:hypothetical protein